jgi:tetratricopeptide (TPR) repeat protein
MPLPSHLTLRVAICLSAACLSASCSSSDAQAQDALNDYQTATAANDLAGARRALLKLVRAKDDVADYWAELGKIQAALGRSGDAYFAYTRAYELDRSNPNLLRSVVEYALRTGDLPMAETRAKELEVVSPDDPLVKLTKGWTAVSELRYDQALSIADSVLAASPFDTGGAIIKARALLGLNRGPEAEALLTKQVQAQPLDSGSLELLTRIYFRRGDWAKATEAARRLNALTPSDKDNALLLIEAAFRSGNVTVGRAASARLLKPNTEPVDIAPVLDLWANYWPSPQRLQDARTLASSAAGPDQRLAYASFLSRMGSPADAGRIAAIDAKLPVDAHSAEANAVLGDALFRMGRLADAKNRLDAVIAFDPGNATALRGRAELELKIGRADAAVIDAQKLITVVTRSSEDRLLLARSFAAAGKPDWAERTLWTAFQDIPGDEKILAALEATKKGDSDANRELEDEFARQRDALLGRGLL